MVRIENSEVDLSDKENLKKEIKKEIKPKVIKKKKGFFSCGGCFLIFVILSATIVVFLAGAVAKTGLIRVPVLTSWLYSEPEPSRAVQYFDGEIGETLENKINSAITKKATAQDIGQEINFTFSLTEEELTALLNKNIAPNEEPLNPIGGQVAVNPEEIELYLDINSFSEGLDSAILIRFYPAIYNNQINITVSGLKIGTMPLPAFMGDALVGLFLKDYLNRASEAISFFGDIQRINLEEGSLSINSSATLRALK